MCCVFKLEGFGQNLREKLTLEKVAMSATCLCRGSRGVYRSIPSSALSQPVKRQPPKSSSTSRTARSAEQRAGRKIEEMTQPDAAADFMGVVAGGEARHSPSRDKNIPTPQSDDAGNVLRPREARRVARPLLKRIERKMHEKLTFCRGAKNIPTSENTTAAVPHIRGSRRGVLRVLYRKDSGKNKRETYWPSTAGQRLGLRAKLRSHFSASAPQGALKRGRVRGGIGFAGWRVCGANLDTGGALLEGERALSGEYRGRNWTGSRRKMGIVELVRLGRGQGPSVFLWVMMRGRLTPGVPAKTVPKQHSRMTEPNLRHRHVGLEKEVGHKKILTVLYHKDRSDNWLWNAR
ncbi:hypothetical protein C8J57DRAFT_1244179 [Mycena rebaudengoi]|nr:hypothetical protein C8J57DRAFT_1244179 [Mycena rebaudengoi]